MGSVAWGGAGLALFVSLGCNGATAPSPAVAAAPSSAAQEARSLSRTVTNPHSVAGCSILTDGDVSGVLKLSIVRRSSGASDELEHTCTDTFEVVGNAAALTRGSSTAHPEQVFAIHEYRDLRLINTPEKLKLIPSGYAEEWPMNLDAEAKLLVPRTGVDEAAKLLILRKNGRLIVLQSFAKAAGQPTFNKSQLLALGKTISGRM